MFGECLTLRGNIDYLVCPFQIAYTYLYFGPGYLDNKILGYPIGRSEICVITVISKPDLAHICLSED